MDTQLQLSWSDEPDRGRAANIYSLGKTSQHRGLQNVSTSLQFPILSYLSSVCTEDGCSLRSHGNISHHVQVSLDPKIDHSKFRLFSGFGQQLGLIVFFGAAGVIDGLAAIFPRTVSRLMDLAEQRPIEPKVLEDIQSMQFAVSSAKEFIGAWGIMGIKESIECSA